MSPYTSGAEYRPHRGLAAPAVGCNFFIKKLPLPPIPRLSIPGSTTFAIYNVVPSTLEKIQSADFWLSSFWTSNQPIHTSISALLINFVSRIC